MLEGPKIPDSPFGTVPSGNCNHHLENSHLPTGHLQTGHLETPGFQYSVLQRLDKTRF